MIRLLSYPAIVAPLVMALWFFQSEGALSGTSGTMVPGIIPVEDLFRKPEQDKFRLSPDGRSVSCLAPFQGRMNLQIHELPCGSPRFVTAFNDRDIAFQLWKSNGILLFGKDVGGDETYHLFKVHADGSGLTDLTPFDGGRATLLDELPDDSEHVLITLTLPHRQSADVYRLNVRSGGMVKAAENDGYIVDWLADHQGQVRIGVEKRGDKIRLLHRLSEDSPFEPIFEVGLDETVRPLLFTFDNVDLYAASNVGRDKLALVVLNLQRRVEKETLFGHESFDVHALNHSRSRKLLTSVSYLGWKMENHFFDPLSRSLLESWAQRFDGSEIEVVDASTDEQVHLLRIASDLSPARYFLARAGSSELTHLAETGPSLPQARLCPMEPIRVPARDGHVLHGYLTRPQSPRSAPHPAVVIVHGGPWQRDRWRYDPEVQFLANRGYAVLQLNFRGSTGYGKAFWKASFKEWGRGMQDDLTDGVQWLIRKRIADPDRVAVYGSSYGGYASLAGLTRTQEIYACGIAVSAPTDLCRLLENLPSRWRPFGPSLHQMIGDPVRDRELLEAVSPAKWMDAVRVPLLMAHGKLDPRVPYEEALSYADGLRRKGVPVQWLLFENEGHWINGEETRIRFYRALEDFLSTHLKERKRETEGKHRR